jgi:hypothetical protein
LILGLGDFDGERLDFVCVDNESQDVDFVAQELKAAGLTVKLDRWNIGAGKRLWLR